MNVVNFHCENIAIEINASTPMLKVKHVPKNFAWTGVFQSAELPSIFLSCYYNQYCIQNIFHLV